MDEKRDRPDMNQMKDLMTCPVCAQLFREPKILPCLHSFCTSCLENLVSSDAQQRSSLICPQCRRRVQIPGEGVSSLQTNLFAQNMLTVIALDTSSVNQISCENCISKEPPVTRCTICRKFLCNFCSTAHRRSRDTMDHHLSSLEDVRSCLPGELAKPLFCSAHKKEKLVLYCESCQSSVCRDCTMMEHRSHKYSFAKEIYNKERGKISEQLSEVRSMGLFLKQGLASVSDMRASVDERTRSMIRELNDIFTQCMRTINERYSLLYNQVQNIRNERLLHLDAQKSELEYAFGSIQSGIGFTELTLRNSTQIEVLTMKKYIMDRMKELTGSQYNCVPVADDNIRLTVDGSIMQLLSQLGVIEDTNTSPTESKVKGIDSPVVVRQMASFTIQSFDGRGNPRSKGGDRVVVTVQSTEEAALCVKNEKCFQAQVIDRQNGTYTVTYTPVTSGDHLITVFINGMVVKGSPFSVHVHDSSLFLQSTPQSTSDQSRGLDVQMLHFVNSTQTFEVDSRRSDAKRNNGDIDVPVAGKKFKLEPNDLDSLPDQLFAHSPDVIRIKQENDRQRTICERNNKDGLESHRPSTENSTEQATISKVKQEPSTSSNVAGFLSDSPGPRMKYHSPGYMNPSSTESVMFHSPGNNSGELSTSENNETIKDQAGPSTPVENTQSNKYPVSPSHPPTYNIHTPEPVFVMHENPVELEREVVNSQTDDQPKQIKQEQPEDSVNRGADINCDIVKSEQDLIELPRVLISDCDGNTNLNDQGVGKE